MSTVDRGHARERQWMKHLQDEGYFACRPRWAGVDVIALKAGEPVYFDEVKASSRGPYQDFSPAERGLLRLEAEKAGAVPRLVWWPPGKAQVAPKVIPSEDWPS